METPLRIAIALDLAERCAQHQDVFLAVRCHARKNPRWRYVVDESPGYNQHLRAELFQHDDGVIAGAINNFTGCVVLYGLGLLRLRAVSALGLHHLCTSDAGTKERGSRSESVRQSICNFSGGAHLGTRGPCARRVVRHSQAANQSDLGRPPTG